MNATYFGRSERQLLGIHHEARGKAARDLAVLLCYPAAQEYLRAHWAFRRLADLLSKEGLSAFRFDYFGTGDSAGSLGAATAADWVQDIQTAAAELLDVSGATHLALVGFRFGATLAAEAVRKGLKVRELVLWEPVSNGRAHLAELEELERKKQAISRTPPRPTPGVTEVLGVVVTPALRDSIAAFDLLAAPPPPTQRTVLAVSEELPEYAALREHYRKAGAELSYLYVPEEAGGGRGDVDSAMLSSVILQGIVSQLAPRAA